MSDRADRREETRRIAIAKTAKTIRETAQKAGHIMTHTQALDRVARAERTRNEEG